MTRFEKLCMYDWSALAETARWIWWITALVGGASVGSFLTLASWRLPRDESLIAPPSRCPGCNHRLGFKDLFPILSWAARRGRCAHCATRVSARYPAIELVTALAVFATILHTGPVWAALPLVLLVCAVILLIITDLEHWIIPDEVHWLLIPTGLLWRALPLFDRMATADDFGLLLIGPTVGLLIGLTLHYGYFWLRGKHGLGMGDVKFLATAGAWLGALDLVPYLFYSGLLGVLFAGIWRVIRRGQHDAGHFPFGPALGVSLLFGAFWPESFSLFWTWPSLLIR